MDYPTARRIALRLLSMRNYHTAVLLRKLEAKGCPEEIAEQIIQDCKRMGFLNDGEAILAELRKGYGPRAIEYKLRLRPEEVRKWVTRDLQKKRIEEFAKKDQPKEKAIRALQRRGFDFDLVLEIFSRSNFQ